MHTKSLIKRLLRIDRIAIDNVKFEMNNDEIVMENFLQIGAIHTPQIANGLSFGSKNS